MTIMATICAAKDCGNPAFCKGWCGGHYQRVRTHGDPQEWKPLQVKAKTTARETCRLDGCGAPIAVKYCELCWAHYLRQQRKGDAEAGPAYRRGDDLARYWSHVSKNGPIPARHPELGPCHPWTGPLSDKGYGRMKIGDRTIGATRFLVSVVLGEPLGDDEEVCHHCDNPPCQNRRHLFVSDHLGNIRDMDAKGRCQRARGEEQGNSKLIEVQVQEIRQRYIIVAVTARTGGRALALEFGVCEKHD